MSHEGASWAEPLVDLPSRDDGALLAPGRAALSYGGLGEAVARLAADLTERGIGPGDAVGLIGPNGPEMAVAFLALASVAAAAPLNPSLRRAELTFEIDDLGLRAVVIVARAGADPVVHPIEAVAATAGIPVWRAEADLDAPAGMVRLVGEADVVRSAAVKAGFDPSIGLVLHTSGTTARPKIVPLSRANLRASAAAVAASLELTPGDRGLVLMPLFHVHGLVAGLLAPLTAGGSVVCPPGFLAPDVPGWWAESSPTWFSAAPTMHQALVDRLARVPGERPDHPLRFVRSSSSALAPQLMVRAENAYGAPLVEAYGMTEAAHQIAVNPLPPGERRAGSVGRAAGPEVAVLGAEGELVAPGVEGELVIRGSNVMAAYAAGAEVNDAAFHDGWFRTGDQGRIDGDGYITITGRLKEVINRGGEKISPREVDEVLLDHPAVSQAVTFALPDHRLGEDVAAAVVAAPGAAPGERELRQFVSLRLAPFKVPRRVLVLAELPVGATGKLQRVGLADRLGLDGDEPSERPPFTAPRTDIERFVAQLWSETLGQTDLSVLDHFLDLGGDSMLAARLLAAVRDQLDLEISMLDFFDQPTIARQAALVEERLIADADVVLDAGA